MINMSAILITKDVWINSTLSIARFYGGIHINETRYIIMGGEQDLVDNNFAKYYHKLGRNRFIQVLEQNRHADKGFVMQAMKDALNERKAVKQAEKQQDNKQQTKLEL